MFRIAAAWSGLLLATLACLCAGGKELNGMERHALFRLAKSADMRAYMNTSVNPCDDFYAYACGNWPRINPTYRERKTGIFFTLIKAYTRRVQRLLIRPKLSSETDMDRKVKYFYESCLDAEQMRHNYRAKLLNVMEEFGGMPALKGERWREERFDWLQVVARILRKYGKTIILGVYVMPDLMNNEVNRLYIGQEKSVLTPQTLDANEGRRLEWQVQLQKVLGLSSELALKTAKEMLEFERRLADGVSDPQEGLGIEDKTRLRMLDEMSDTYKPVLNFTTFVHTWLGYEYRLPVYEYVETYLINLRRTILNTPSSVVANYIMWELLRELRIEARASDDEQRTMCVELTIKHFTKYVDNIVYRDLLEYHSEHIDDVQVLWTQLKRAFELMLQPNRTAWLTEITRDKALEKLSAMTYEINSYGAEDFNEEFGDLIISTTNFFENVLNCLELRGRNYRQLIEEPPRIEFDTELSFTPVYIAPVNKVFIPVSFLQPRYLWDALYPMALMYATAGSMIGHEVAHGFDDTLRKFDAKGNFNNWWDRKSTDAFVQRRDCFEQQLSEFRYNGIEMPLLHAQGENIADNVGLRIAYTAYEAWLASSTPAKQHETLPHLSYTPRQLFFIALSQLWCSEVHTTLRRSLMLSDVHPPESVRVTSMLSNFEEFGLEFKCQPGTKMHPKRKCVLFY